MVIVRWDTGVRAADKRAYLLGGQFGSTKRYPIHPPHAIHLSERDHELRFPQP